MGLCFLGQKKWSCHGNFFNNIIKIETDLGDKPLKPPTMIVCVVRVSN